MCAGVDHRFLPGHRQHSEVLYTSDGYKYHFNTERNDNSYYKCAFYYNNDCHGRGIMRDEDGVFIPSKEHNHRPNPYLYLLQRMRQTILTQCLGNIWRPPSEIVRDIVVLANRRHGVPREITAEISLNQMRSAIWRFRQRNFPPLPQSLDDLAESLLAFPNLTTSIDLLDNIFAGSFGNEALGTKCLFFSSQRLRTFMANVEEVFVDGTFKVRFPIPANRQLYSIVTCWRGHIIQLMWVVMQTKSEACYVEVLEAIRHLVPDFTPRVVHCDFEDAQTNAWLRVFDDVIIFGCYYHFVDAILRKANMIGLRGAIEGDEEADSLLRSFCALPLLPADSIGLGLLALGEKANDLGVMEEFREFFEYMHTEWMPKTEVLSVYGAEHRTNNCAESNNRMIGRQLTRIHPNVYELIGTFVKMEENAIQDIHALRLGFSPSRQRRRSAILNDAAIRNLTQDARNGRITILHFLRAASHRVQNVYDRRMAAHRNVQNEADE